jgi:hypothetical protein
METSSLVLATAQVDVDMVTQCGYTTFVPLHRSLPLYPACRAIASLFHLSLPHPRTTLQQSHITSRMDIRERVVASVRKTKEKVKEKSERLSLRSRKRSQSRSPLPADSASTPCTPNAGLGASLPDDGEPENNVRNLILSPSSIHPLKPHNFASN